MALLRSAWGPVLGEPSRQVEQQGLAARQQVRLPTEGEKVPWRRGFIFPGKWDVQGLGGVEAMLGSHVSATDAGGEGSGGGHRQTSWHACWRLCWGLRVHRVPVQPSLTCQLHPCGAEPGGPVGASPSRLAALPQTFLQILAKSSDGKMIS